MTFPLRNIIEGRKKDWSALINTVRVSNSLKQKNPTRYPEIH